jgi:hypothetical protein
MELGCPRKGLSISYSSLDRPTQTNPFSVLLRLLLRATAISVSLQSHFGCLACFGRLTPVQSWHPKKAEQTRFHRQKPISGWKPVAMDLNWVYWQTFQRLV